MTAPTQQQDDLIRSAARRLKGYQRRLFQAEVASRLCGGDPRAAERRFGWGRGSVAVGLREATSGIRCVENFPARGKLPAEVKDPQLAADIRSLVEPHAQADPELKSARRYSSLSSREVREALQKHKGYGDDRLPSERTLRDILNRLGYRLERIQKAKPLKKLPQTDAVFANVAVARQQYKGDPETLEISYDAKAKVNEGDYCRGEKARTDSRGRLPKGLDHDPPAKRRWTPLGILMLATGALTLIFGEGNTSDYWADGLKVWWLAVKDKAGPIKRLVVYLDNGPCNAGNRTQWLVRMIEFADWSGLEVRLVYHPAYHSKYNPIEHCWGVLEQKWSGTLLNSLKVIPQQALRMSWCGRPPVVKRLEGDYPGGVRLSRAQMKAYEERLRRSATLPKYDITITPIQNVRQVS